MSETWTQIPEYNNIYEILMILIMLLVYLKMEKQSNDMYIG